MEMTKKEEKKSEGIWSIIFVFGGVLGGWCAIIGSLVRFIIDGIQYFS